MISVCISEPKITIYLKLKKRKPFILNFDFGPKLLSKFGPARRTTLLLTSRIITLGYRGCLEARRASLLTADCPFPETASTRLDLVDNLLLCLISISGLAFWDCYKHDCL